MEDYSLEIKTEVEHYVYKIGKKIKISSLTLDKKYGKGALKAYYEALSNFGRRAVQTIQLVGVFKNYYQAKLYAKHNRKEIENMPPVYHYGEFMNELYEPILEEDYSREHPRQCPVCKRSGWKRSFVEKHFENCTASHISNNGKRKKNNTIE
jgi:hypothetical protein